MHLIHLYPDLIPVTTWKELHSYLGDAGYELDEFVYGGGVVVVISKNEIDDFETANDIVETLVSSHRFEIAKSVETEGFFAFALQSWE